MADSIDAEGLIRIVDRVERLQEEEKGLKDDIKDVFLEAKAKGYEPKLIKKCLALKKVDAETRRLEEEELELYKAALSID